MALIWVFVPWQAGAGCPSSMPLSTLEEDQPVPSAAPRQSRQVPTKTWAGSPGSWVQAAGSESAAPSAPVCALPTCRPKSPGPQSAPRAQPLMETPAPEVASHVPACAPRPASTWRPGPGTAACHAPDPPPEVPEAPRAANCTAGLAGSTAMSPTSARPARVAFRFV